MTPVEVTKEEVTLNSDRDTHETISPEKPQKKSGATVDKKQH